MKVALAARFFDRADGLDYDPGYVEAARANLEMMQADRCRAFQADGVTFGGYGDYDVIYVFKPMDDARGLREMELRITSDCRPGTVLIAPYTEFRLRFDSLGCQHVAADVFLSDSDPAAAAALAAAARRIGPHQLWHGSEVPRGAGWPRPLWLACQANGIRPGP